jgi:hypothetical protein
METQAAMAGALATTSKQAATTDAADIAKTSPVVTPPTTAAETPTTITEIALVEIGMLTVNTPPHGINLYSHDLVHLRISATKFRCPS